MNAISTSPAKPFSYLARIDKTALSMILLLAAVALIDPPQILTSLEFVFRAATRTLPFLFLSVALAAYAKASGSDNLIARAFTGSPRTAIAAAALMGALSPFCSCGVIPIIAALLSMGVPLGPVMAFWLASPLMDPSMFLLTTATLGLEFAVAKTLAAIAIGVLSGTVAALLVRAGLIDEVLREHVGNGGCAGSKIRNPKAVVWAVWNEPARREVLLKGMMANALMLGKWLLLAFLLESLMVAWMPDTIASSLIGLDGFTPILAATLIGIPSYLNGYAALPLVHGLMEQGLAPGAAMSFLVAGGVTSVPAMMAVWAVTTKRVFALYCTLGTTLSVLVGLAYAQWVQL